MKKTETRLFLFLALLCFTKVHSQCTAGSSAATTYLQGTTSWSAAGLPTSGAVTIPAGTKVKLDQDLTLTSLTVRGELYFDIKDVSLTSSFIEVDGGTFAIGSTGCRYNNKATITLTGTMPSDRAAVEAQPGYKYFRVINSGKLFLYGYHPSAAWTKLSASLNKGDNTITVIDALGWKVGDEIVVASSDFDATQAEIFSIASVVSSKSYQLNTTAANTHWGGLDKYIDERAEVALLSRPITIQGDYDSYAQGFGAHFMMAPTFANAHVEGVEFKRMGQKNVLGKYPIHFHMAGDVTARAAKVLFNVVHSSFQRCVVIHATNGLQVADNVCLRSVGHGYFIEDGIETGNTIERNIAIDIRAGALLPSDSEATGYWITNPNNTIRYNVAAGTINNCFWYALPEHPLGPSAAGNENYWNRRIPLGVFLNNTAHSCGSDGLHVDRGPRADNTLSTGTYSPLTVPTNSSSPASKAIFENFTAYKCRNRGTWFRGGRLELKNALFADNAIGCTFAHGGGAYQSLDGATVIGETQNVGSPQSWESKGLYGRSLPKYSPWPIRGIEFYDGPVVFKDVKFYNFKPDEIRPAGAFSVLRQDEFSIITTNQLQGATFHNSVVNRVYYPEIWNDGDKNQVFKDLYGSVTGTPGFVVTDLPFLKTPACDTRPNMKAAVCKTPEHNYVRLAINNNVASSQTYRKSSSGASLIGLMVTRDNGTMGYPQQHLWGDPVDADIRGSWGVSMLTKQRYILGFNQVTPKDMRIYMQYGNITDYVVLGVRYPAGTVFDCTSCILQANWYPDMRANKVNSIAEVENGDGMRWFFDATTNLLWFKLLYSSTTPRAWDDYTGSNGQPVIYIVPQFPSSQDLSQCPVGLAEDFPVYWNNDRCANSENPDNQCPAFPYCAGHGYCNTGSSSCTCDAGWRGSYCQQADCSVLFPTCNGHGTCSSSTGKCTCSSGWYGSDCTKANTCPNNCSGKGTCVNGACVCNTNYGGDDCGTYYMVRSPSTWKYLVPNGYQQPWPCCPEYPFTITFPNITTFFNKTTFDDSAWPSASSPFYYGTTPPKPGGTVIGDFCNTWNCDDSYYFRKSFTLTTTDISTMKSAVIHVASDNGADVYINGVLVDRDNDDHDERYWNRELEIPTSVFVSGTNVIAIYLANQDWSTDAYFDMELTYRADQPCAGVTCGSNEKCVLGQCRCIDGYIPNSEGTCLVPGALQCTPNCNGRTCGDDGCGGTCGSCTGSNSCVSGTCVCQRSCTNKQCGSDGCGGTCGTCSGSQTCNGAQQCVCVGNCTGRVCGDNGCGGSCGTCSTGNICKVGGTCVSSCTPNCAGRECGNDGCGGTCGTCTGGKICSSSGICECVANCIGASCGNDGCGGACGTCAMGYGCNVTSRSCEFTCVPDCNGRACGSDGCGGSCGTCTGSLSCKDSQCVSNTDPCSGITCSDPNANCDPRFGTCVCKDDFISIGGGPCTSRLQNDCADVICPDPNMVCTAGLCECTNGYTDATQTQCKACAEGDVQVCYVSNGKGTKTCKSGTFEACVATDCDPGHVLLNGLCDATTCTPGQVASCNIENGLGQKTCPTSFVFSECQVTACNMGYVQQDNQCLDPSAIAAAESSEGGSALIPGGVGVLAGIIAGAAALVVIVAVTIIVIKKRKASSWY